MRLAVGIPSNGEIKSETVTCLIEALFRTRMNQLGLIFPNGCLIHENRIAIAEEALSKGYTHLMCIDSDITFPADAINRLAMQNKDIIGANYHVRGAIPPKNTVLYSSGGQCQSTILPSVTFKCDGLAMGFVLIKTDVFNRITKPWFFFEALSGNSFMGEDYWFCERAKEAGIDIWCDPTIQLGHLGVCKY